MTERYLVKAKNPKYEGKTFGVRFHEGKAVVDEHSISKHLGRSVKEVVALMQADFGLEVEPLDETTPAPKEDTPKAPVKKVKKETADD